MMSWFRKERRPAQVHTSLGHFTYCDHPPGSWVCDTNSTGLLLIYDQQELEIDALGQLELMIRDVDNLRKIAETYGQNSECWNDANDLTLESIDFTEILDGRFGLTFGSTQNPDLTVTVELQDGKPIEVWAGD